MEVEAKMVRKNRDAEIRLRFGDIKSQSWTLLNGVKQNAEFPDTFEIPDDDDRNGLRVGDYAKVCFIPDEAGLISERMWCIVKQRVGARYIGTLDNDPVNFDMQPGCLVEFGPENVLSVLPKQE